MIMMISAALAAAAPAAPATPPADVHAQHQAQAMSGHEQTMDCSKCCYEMMPRCTSIISRSIPSTAIVS